MFRARPLDPSHFLIFHLLSVKCCEDVFGVERHQPQRKLPSRRCQFNGKTGSSIYTLSTLTSQHANQVASVLGVSSNPTANDLLKIDDWQLKAIAIMLSPTSMFGARQFWHFWTPPNGGLRRRVGPCTMPIGERKKGRRENVQNKTATWQKQQENSKQFVVLHLSLWKSTTAAPPVPSCGDCRRGHPARKSQSRKLNAIPPSPWLTSKI